MDHQATLSPKGNNSWEEGDRGALVGVVVVQQLVERDQGARPAHARAAVDQDRTFDVGVDTYSLLSKAETYLVLGGEPLSCGRGRGGAEGCPAPRGPATALSAAASPLFCFRPAV